jgi:hypothetical protein
MQAHIALKALQTASRSFSTCVVSVEHWQNDTTAAKDKAFSDRNGQFPDLDFPKAPWPCGCNEKGSFGVD